MSSADLLGVIVARWLRNRPRRYGFAVALVGCGDSSALRSRCPVWAYSAFCGFPPAIILVALCADFGPGVLATFLSSASVASFFWTSLNVFGNSRPREIVGLVLFCGVGTSISGLGWLFRRHHSRLLEIEKVVEGLEEMIVVIDRSYRYLIANRAFLQHRNMKSEEVIGRHATEILNPEVFEKVIKGRLDQCFRGKNEVNHLNPSSSLADR